MNWINKFFLALVMLPAKLYRIWGVDTKHLRAILTVKLMMDDRRPNTIQSRRQYRGSEEEISNATLGTMMISFFMGLAFLATFMLGEDYLTKLTLYFSLFITFLCMTLVSDFTAVLIDVRDTYIILPKPVTDRSFVTARLLHIVIHICKLVIPMGLPCFIYLLLKAPLGAPFIFVLVLLLATLMAIFLINAVYILILRITTPDKFKNIISNVQIVFAIVVYASYQILPKMMDADEMSHFSVGDSPVLLALPPFWFGSAFNLLLTGEGSMLHIISSCLAVLMPLGSIYVVVKYLAPAFNQKLAMISGSGSSPEITPATPALATAGKKGFATWVSTWLTSNQVEQTGFMFTWKMMLRSREFRVKVYPTIGYLVVLMGTMLYNDIRYVKDGEIGTKLAVGFGPMLVIYLSNMIIVAAISAMIYSEKYKATWMFFVTPVNRPGDVISGGLKAVVVQFSMFIALFALVLGLVFIGPSILPNIFLALCNQLLISFSIAAIGFKQLPFSQPMKGADQGGQFMRSIFMLFISILLAGAHYLAYKNIMAIVLVLLVSATALALVLRYIRKIRWEALPVPD